LFSLGITILVNPAVLEGKRNVLLKGELRIAYRISAGKSVGKRLLDEKLV
jgi:hypothetical protein